LDETPGIAPLLHAVELLEENESYFPDLIICLQPTTPFRNSDDIEKAVSVLKEKNAESVVSVVEPKHHPHWMKTIDSNGKLSDYFSLNEKATRRQDLPGLFVLNGAIYLAKTDVFVHKQTWYTERTYAYIMPPERSVDIDSPWELFVANLLMEEKQKNRV